MTLKKHTHKTQTFPTTPLHTKKIITLKKRTHKPESNYVTLFISIIFKVTKFIKSIHTKPKHFQ